MCLCVCVCVCGVVRNNRHVLFFTNILPAKSILGTGLRGDFLSSFSTEFHTCVSVEITFKFSTLKHATLTLFRDVSCNIFKIFIIPHVPDIYVVLIKKMNLHPS